MAKICIFISVSRMMADHITDNRFAHRIVVYVYNGVHIKHVREVSEFVCDARICRSSVNLLWPISPVIDDDRHFVCHCHRCLAKTGTQFSEGVVSTYTCSTLLKPCRTALSLSANWQLLLYTDYLALFTHHLLIYYEIRNAGRQREKWEQRQWW